MWPRPAQSDPAAPAFLGQVFAITAMGGAGPQPLQPLPESLRRRPSPTSSALPTARAVMLSEARARPPEPPPPSAGEATSSLARALRTVRRAVALAAFPLWPRTDVLTFHFSPADAAAARRRLLRRSLAQAGRIGGGTPQSARTDSALVSASAVTGVPLSAAITLAVGQRAAGGPVRAADPTDLTDPTDPRPRAWAFRRDDAQARAAPQKPSGRGTPPPGRLGDGPC